MLYGGSGETHEVAFTKSESYQMLEGNGVLTKRQNGTLIINWAVTPARKIVRIGRDLYVYLLGSVLYDLCKTTADKIFRS